MINDINNFIESKKLSLNSRKSYHYDLKQFYKIIGGHVNSEKLALYQQSLSEFKLTARKRKLSAVNQFLFFLYNRGTLKEFYRLQETEKITLAQTKSQIMDLSNFYQDTDYPSGRLIALLILSLGLTPAEIANLKKADFDTTFNILSIEKSQMKRILKLPEDLLPFLLESLEEGGDLVFEHNGKPYSRQWFFNQLTDFLNEKNEQQLTAQLLREQFILKQKENGKTMTELSRLLGLKTPITLERYYR
ncbi:TPA: site-specific tyrosine recombinase XerD [Streptococcus agalactiae]